MSFPVPRPALVIRYSYPHLARPRSSARRKGDPSTVAYGMLPPGSMTVLRERLAQRRRAKLAVTTRTE